MASTPSRAELLELDIDIRLIAVLVQADEAVGVDGELAAFLRMAYGAGYLDALRERRRGQLCRDHGLVIPDREVA